MNTIETIRFLGAGLPLLLCILAEARLLTLLRDDRSGWLGAMAIAVAVLAIPLAFMYFRSRRRLSRTVRLFHSVESRRTRTTYVPIVAGTLAGAGAILYLGGRLFLDDPSIARAVLVMGGIMLWLIGAPFAAAAIVTARRR